MTEPILQQTNSHFDPAEFRSLSSPGLPDRHKFSAQDQERISEEMRRAFGILTLIANNPRLQATVGEAGAGSFIQLGAGLVTLDPVHLLAPGQGWVFIVAHEAGHEVHTKSLMDPNLLRILETKHPGVRQLVGQIGFASILNAIEDIAINSWLVKAFPGLESLKNQLYDKECASENPEFHTGETAAISGRLGYYPRFAKFLSEIVRHWHSGFYSTTLDPEVAGALYRCEESIKRCADSIANFPQTPTTTQSLRGFVFRVSEIVKNIWPEVETLVRLDIPDLVDSKLVEIALKASSPLSGALSAEAKIELRRLADRQRAAVSEGYKNLEMQLNKQISELPSIPTPGLSQLDRDVLRKKFADLLQDRNAVQELRRKNEEAKTPLDLSQASESTKKEIAELKNKYSAEAKAAEQQVREDLEKFEDAFRKLFEAKSGPRIPTHEEMRQAKSDRVSDAELDLTKEFLRNIGEGAIRSWQDSLITIGPDLQRMLVRLKKVLKPIVPEWEPGYSSGPRVNLKRAMQAEVDERKLKEVFERKSLARERSYEFILCLDVSGSMNEEQGRKLVYARHATVMFVETLARLKVPCGTWVFGSDRHRLMKSGERLGELQRRRISGALQAGRGGTKDYFCIQAAHQELLHSRAEYKFIFVVTDGGSDHPQLLDQVLREIATKGKVILIGIGIGPGTSQVSQVYPHGRGELVLKKTRTGEVELVEYVADTLEKALIDPTIFKTYKKK